MNISPLASYRLAAAPVPVAALPHRHQIVLGVLGHHHRRDLIEPAANRPHLLKQRNVFLGRHTVTLAATRAERP
jgi:hypothetical protein